MKKIDVKIIDIQNRDYIFTQYKSNTIDEAIAKLERVYGLEVESLEFYRNELNIYCYIDH